MEQWATEVRTKTRPGQLKVTTHHGPTRTKSKFFEIKLTIAGRKLEGYDVVITTYQTLASEHAQDAVESDSDNPKRGGVLFSQKWHRVVLGGCRYLLCSSRQAESERPTSRSIVGLYT
jgi:SNF2 family DNA or RNA helicase